MQYFITAHHNDPSYESVSINDFRKLLRLAKSAGIVAVRIDIRFNHKQNWERTVACIKAILKEQLLFIPLFSSFEKTTSVIEIITTAKKIAAIVPSPPFLQLGNELNTMAYSSREQWFYDLLSQSIPHVKKLFPHSPLFTSLCVTIPVPFLFRENNALLPHYDGILFDYYPLPSMLPFGSVNSLQQLSNKISFYKKIFPKQYMNIGEIGSLQLFGFGKKHQEDTVKKIVALLQPLGMEWVGLYQLQDYPGNRWYDYGLAHGLQNIIAGTL